MSFCYLHYQVRFGCWFSFDACVGLDVASAVTAGFALGCNAMIIEKLKGFIE
jgi:hypothetical protein